MSKHVVESEKPQMTICRMRVACWISNGTRSYAFSCTRARTSTHTYARWHTHAPTGGAHAEKYVIIIAFPRRQWSECYVIRTSPVLLK